MARKISLTKSGALLAVAASLMLGACAADADVWTDARRRDVTDQIMVETTMNEQQSQCVTDKMAATWSYGQLRALDDDDVVSGSQKLAFQVQCRKQFPRPEGEDTASGMALVAPTESAAASLDCTGLMCQSLPTPRSTSSSATTAPTTSPVPSTGSLGSYQPPTVLEDPGESSSGTWIAQFASVSFDDGHGALTEMLTSVRASIPDAVVLVSDDYASLRPGYWVVYQPGPFPDGFAAVRYCDARGRTTRNSCIGRLLSHHAVDIKAQCFRRDDGVYTDACSA